MSAVAEVRWTSQDARQELHTMFANAPVGVARCDRDGTITAINPVLERMLRVSPGMAQSLRLADLMTCTEHSEVEERLRELFQGERDNFQIESEIGEENRRLRWTAWRVPGRHSTTDYALAVAEEMAATQQTEQPFRQAEGLEAVGRLAGGVVHDFNNLLTGVLLYCDLLMAGLEPGNRLRKYAEEIRNASLQATGLVRQLLAVARPSARSPQALSFNEIAEGMRNLLVRLIGENIEIKFRLDPRLGLIRMDPAQAQQILLNLVLNARDALPGGGQISVETSDCKIQVLSEARVASGASASIPCALLSVGDNGCGMDAATRTHLFEAFFTTKASGRGTGLGLATVYDIVTRNGGLIHVDSAPACGTQFTVLLPLVPESMPNDSCPNLRPAGEFEPERNVKLFPTEQKE